MMFLGQVLLLSLQARAQGTDRGRDGTPGQLPSLPPPAAVPLAPPQSLPRTAVRPPAYPPPPALPPPPTPDAVRDRMPRPEPEPGAYVHDGFYLRFGVGAGYVTETIEWTDGGAASSEVTGPAFPIDIAMGGTLGSGFVLGGAFHTMLLGRDRSNLPLPESERGGQHSLSALGLFADWYLNPEAGFHVQGMVGGGSLLMSDTSSSDYAPTGSTISLGAGHEWWIGPDSSLGILARVDWATFTYQDDETSIDYDHRLLHVGLMGTATYH